MSIYIKQFDPGNNSTFSKILTSKKNGASVTVGNLGPVGCMVSVDVNGNILAQLEYFLGDAAISFTGIVETLNGYLVFGARKANEERSQALVVRMDTEGKVLWSKIYHTATTRKPVGMIPANFWESGTPYPEFFIFANRNTADFGMDDIELIKIDLTGKVLASKMLAIQIDQSSSVSLGLFGTGAALYGGAFLIGFDFNLNLNYRKLLGDAINLDILSVNAAGNQHIATGVVHTIKPQTGPGRPMAEFLSYSFLFKFDVNSVGITANAYDLMPYFDQGIRTLVSNNDATPSHYLFASYDTGSVTAKFDNQLNLLWSKRLNIPDNNYIADAVYSTATNEIILCGGVLKGAEKSPLIGRTDKEYTSCLTLENPKPGLIPFNFEFKNWDFAERAYQPTVNNVDLQVLSEPIPNHYLCTTTPISLSGLIQSPYLYLQAAGSDQSDDSSKGIHLRWRFQKSLGEHLAKGEYTNAASPYFTNIGFNKPNDFVKIYRTPYKERFQTRVQIKDTILPTKEIIAGKLRVWWFHNLALSNGTGTSKVNIRFNDSAQYDKIRAGMTTLLPERFIKEYKGVIEVEPLDKLFFSAQFALAYNTGTASQAYLRAEAITYDDPADTASIFVACRKKFLGQAQLNNAQITGENLKYIRLDYSIAYIAEIVFETYVDYITNTSYAWEFLNDFALTLDTAAAFDRLENKNNPLVPVNKKYSVDKQWNKYNEANAVSGAFKIRVDNYKHRWYPAPNAEHPDTKAVDGIQKAIQDYLTLSKTDPKANASLPIQDSPGNKAKLDVSYLDLLRFVGLDFHVARMLGLGHIDADVTDTVYVYLMAYTSKGPLETGNAATLVKDHLYMSLPTSPKNHRLPPVPVQELVTYGMAVDMGFGNTNPLTDNQGYVPFDAVRFVNLNRKLYPYEKSFGAFFADPTEFSLGDETIPIKYGLEYKEQSEAAYRKPEITQDSEYFDAAGFNEVVEIPEQGKNPLYTHQEREEGVHCYGIYAINWFSRVSPLSNIVCTNPTQFQKIKSLLPPSNFAVQLIQAEAPLMLTTDKEQAALKQLTNPDKTLVRATFEWNHNHNVNYQFAERAELFYRDAPPDSIRGEVAAVAQLYNNQVEVEVKDFQILSTDPKQTIAPLIPSGQEQKYIGSLFSCGQQAFVIAGINNSNKPYATFTLNQIKQTESSDPLNNNQIVNVVSWLKPAVGERFLIAENLADKKNWNTRLQRTVYIEKFHTNQVIWLENTGTANNGVYRIEQLLQKGTTTTEFTLLDNLKNDVVAGNIRFEWVFRINSLNLASKQIGIKGSTGNAFVSGTKLRLFGSSYQNDVELTMTGNAASNGNITAIRFTGTIPDPNANFGYLAVEQTALITAINRKAKTVTVKGGAFIDIIKPPYIETKIEYDKTVTKLAYGGIYLSAEVQPLWYETFDPNDGTLIYTEHIGAYTVKFDNNYALPPHIDPSVEWYKGIARIFDKGTPPARKSLQVWEIKKDKNGSIQTPLELIVFDPDFDKTKPTIDLIQTQKGVMVNFHPGYRVYLKPEFNASNANDATYQFNAATIMPAIGEGSKITYMGIRSIDRFKKPPTNNIVQYESYIAPPVPVLAREIVEPAVVGIVGPKFATRPDFYKKSTYTIDLKLDTTAGRKPYGVLAYRGSETQILGTLYSDATLFDILPKIEKLKSNAADRTAYFTMLSALVQADVTASGEFKTSPNSISFTFKLPDNPNYMVPDRDPKAKEFPFLTSKFITKTIPQGAKYSQYEIVKRAILDCFLSLTEQPVIYKYVKGGIATSSKKPLFRNNNGDLITPVLPEDALYDPEKYDPHPMAVKFAKNGNNILLPKDNGYSTAGEFYVRFTDFTLDGASKEYYFYYACEITNQLIIGEAGNIIGPVLMVNTAPAEAPGIREVRTILANPAANEITAVLFKLNKYNDSEGITQFWIYRAYDSADAINIRSMKLAKKVNVGQEAIDDFSDLPIPPYGETLFYKIVAVRSIKNELSADEDILSLPSRLVQTTIVDVINPKAPKLFAENGTSTPAALQNVILKWKPTAYNGTYYLQKLNASGNWEELYRIKVKDADMQYPPLGTNNLPDLPRKDTDGNAIYHRFRVQVENASGLFNLSEAELTLAKGASDLQEMDSALGYSDGNNNQLPTLKSFDFLTGANHPNKMVFTHLNQPLPAGHNTFVAMEITVSEDLGGTFTRTINTPGGTAAFNVGDGGLNLDNAQPNRIYTIRTKLFTDFAPAGALQVFTLNYLSGTTIAIQQGRRSLPAFDARYYLGQYWDLQAAFGAQNYPAATTHWLTFGIKEGRRSSPAFHVSYYLLQHPDLQAAFGAKNYAAALDYWLTNYDTKLSLNSFLLQTGTPLEETNATFEFILAPNRDLFVVKKSKTGSKSTEIQVLSAASHYQQFILKTGTPLPKTDATFGFVLASNRDLFVIMKRKTSSKSTEIQVLSADSHYQQFILKTGTPLPETDATFEFVLASNRDLFVVKKSKTVSKTTEIQVLSAASNYQQIILNTGTILKETDATFEFALAPNRNLFAIKKSKTGTKSTEVHVLSADDNYQRFILETGTALPETDATFEFALAPNRDLFAIKKNNTGSKSTEVHVLSADNNYQ